MSERTWLSSDALPGLRESLALYHDKQLCEILYGIGMLTWAESKRIGGSSRDIAIDILLKKISTLGESEVRGLLDSLGGIPRYSGLVSLLRGLRGCDDENIDDAGLIYKMSSKPRGMAVIVNNLHFTCGMGNRLGSQHDSENLRDLFIYSGFETKIHENLKKDLREFSTNFYRFPTMPTTA